MRQLKLPAFCFAMHGTEWCNEPHSVAALLLSGAISEFQCNRIIADMQTDEGWNTLFPPTFALDFDPLSVCVFLNCFME